MSRKAALAGLIGALEEAGVVIDTDVDSGGPQRTERQLAEIEFKMTSSCGDVTVWLAASGAVRELVIADGALKRHDHQEMGALVTQTIRTAEGVMREAVTEMTRRSLAERSTS
ncbi:MAG: YbaB/EbfC family nucleoid-associated protein [Micromonosporaceae bacterium]